MVRRRRRGAAARPVVPTVEDRFADVTGDDRDDLLAAVRQARDVARDEVWEPLRERDSQWRKPPKGHNGAIQYLVDVAFSANGQRYDAAKELVRRVVAKYAQEPSTTDVFTALVLEVVETAQAEGRLLRGEQ